MCACALLFLNKTTPDPCVHTFPMRPACQPHRPNWMLDYSGWHHWSALSQLLLHRLQLVKILLFCHLQEVVSWFEVALSHFSRAYSSSPDSTATTVTLSNQPLHYNIFIVMFLMCHPPLSAAVFVSYVWSTKHYSSSHSDIEETAVNICSQSDSVAENAQQPQRVCVFILGLALALQCIINL